jgi:predicted small lipoprotein YifL
MRVIFGMRVPARGVATRGAILAVSAMCTALALAACGQRGPLYMPTVPPLPAKPNFETQDTGTAAPAAASEASGVNADSSIPDTSGTPITLSPDNELGTPPASPAPASGAQPTQ